MATNHTTNYNLNLWEPQDDFLRSEFNENTQKIDAAIFSCSSVAGSYTPLGTQPVEVHLGFRPKVVLIAGRGFGFAFGSYCPLVYNSGNWGMVSSASVTFTDDGFTVAAGDSHFNDTGYDVTYVAFH